MIDINDFRTWQIASYTYIRSPWLICSQKWKQLYDICEGHINKIYIGMCLLKPKWCQKCDNEIMKL